MISLNKITPMDRFCDTLYFKTNVLKKDKFFKALW